MKAGNSICCRLFLLLVTLIMGVQCDFKYPTAWTPPDRESFGQEAFKLIRRHIERTNSNPTPRLMLMDTKRNDIVTALDALIPESEGQKVKDMIEALLPLFDDDTLPKVTRKLAVLLRKMALNHNLLTIYTRDEAKVGYSPDPVSIFQRMTEFGNLKELLTRLSKAILEHDGLDDKGNPNSEPDEFTRLQRALSREMVTYIPDPDPNRTAALMVNLLLTEDDRVTRGEPLWAVRVDHRGVAKVNKDSSGEFHAPFVDVNPADGLPDVDSFGRLIDASGQIIDIPPFGNSGLRDNQGLAIVSQITGEHVYDYVDLNRTLFAALVSDLRKFADKDIPFNLFRAAKSLLGDRAAANRGGVDYNGFSGKPALDFLHAIFHAINHNDLPKILEGVKKLIDNSPNATAGALWMLDYMSDLGDLHPEAKLVEGHSFLDGVLDIVKEIVNKPGMLQDLLVALSHPDSATFGTTMAKMMTYKKSRVTIQDVDTNNVFHTRVDRNQPDNHQNRSLFQRMMHLIHDTYGVSYAPEILGFIPGDWIMEVPDLALFYLESFAGRSTIPTVVSWTSGLVWGFDVDATPTPQQIGRLINTEPSLISEPKCYEGKLVREHHGDTLLALEAAGMIPSMKKIVKVFSDHGKTYLFAEFLLLQHMHYASRQSDYQRQNANQDDYSLMNDIRSYEPFLIELFGNEKFNERLRAVAATAKGITVSSGEKLSTVLETFVRFFLNPDANLTTRDGRRSITRSSGLQVSPLTRFDLVSDAMDILDAALEAKPASKSAWEQVRDELKDTLLDTVENSDGSVEFKNKNARIFLIHLLELMRQRTSAHVDAGTLGRKLTVDLMADLEESLTGPLIAATVDFIDVIDADQRLKDLMREFLIHMFPDDGPPVEDLLRVFGAMLHTMRDSYSLQPFVAFWGQELSPDDTLIHKLFTFLDKSMELDTPDTFSGLLRRGFNRKLTGKAPLEVLGELFADLTRLDPASVQNYTVNDYNKVFVDIGDWLLDDADGLEKLIEIIKSRW